jgi:predicted SAM-dependent methyltransferase
MLSYGAKRLYFLAAAPLMYANGLAYRAFRQPRTPIRVHLGPGKTNYIPDWVNVDANPFTAKVDLWANFANRLPFRDNSVAAVYSHHVIEHIRDDALPRHFGELFRVLIPGGAVRIGGPNADGAMRKYLEGDAGWFSDYPRNRASIGGRMVNFVFCANEHMTALTPSYLEELMTGAGFAAPKICLPTRDSAYFGREVLDKEWESDFATPHTLIVEARKPD